MRTSKEQELAFISHPETLAADAKDRDDINVGQRSLFDDGINRAIADREVFCSPQVVEKIQHQAQAMGLGLIDSGVVRRERPDWQMTFSN